MNRIYGFTACMKTVSQLIKIRSSVKIFILYSNFKNNLAVVMIRTDKSLTNTCFKNGTK